MTLPAFAAERQRLLQHGASNAPAAVDRYLPPARRLAANQLTTVAADNRWHTDRYMIPAPHTMQAASTTR